MNYFILGLELPHVCGLGAKLSESCMTVFPPSLQALVLISATVVQRVWKSRTCWKFSKSNKQGSHESN